MRLIIPAFLCFDFRLIFCAPDGRLDIMLTTIDGGANELLLFVKCTASGILLPSPSRVCGMQ